MHEAGIKERHVNPNGFKITEVKRVQAVKLRKAEKYDQALHAQEQKLEQDFEKSHEEDLKKIEEEQFGKRKSNKDKKKLENLKKGFENSSEDGSQN